MPAAIGAYFVAQIVIGLLRVFEVGNNGPDYMSQFLCSIVGPYFFVLAGSKTAPKFHFATALVLTVIFAVTNGALVTAVILKGGGVADTRWWLIVTSVAGIVASVVACYQMRKSDEG